MDKFRIPIGIIVVILLGAIGYFLSTNDYAHRKLLEMIGKNTEVNYEQAKDISKLEALVEKDK